MKIVDSHQHLWDLDRFSYSWLKDAPALNRSHLIQEYADATQGTHIVRTVHIEAGVDEPFILEETRWILSLAQDERTPIAGVVACARPERDDFELYLRQIGGHPALKGVRRVLFNQPEQVWQSSLFIDNLNRLPAHDLSFDLCVRAAQLPLAARLIRQCPEVSFILDHCGMPPVKERQFHPWREHLKELATFPNVVCKISGLPTCANRKNPTVEDLQPFVEHAIECFGWKRVLWGSDWPVCTQAGRLSQWLEAVQQLTQQASNEQRRDLFCNTAVRVYKLD